MNVIRLKCWKSRWSVSLLTCSVVALTVCSPFGGKGTVGAVVSRASRITRDPGTFRGTIRLSDAREIDGLIPKGWKTYTYGEAAISVPRSWVVRHGYYSCASSTFSASGTLFLLPKSISDVCVRSPFNTRSVAISPLPTGSAYEQPSCPPVNVNGLTTYVGPCTSSNPAGTTVWSVPALGIQAAGTGKASENVTGSKNGSVVGRVLRTLRRRR
jgi:hypothetical protein